MKFLSPMQSAIVQISLSKFIFQEFNNKNEATPVMKSEVKLSHEKLNQQIEKLNEEIKQLKEQKDVLQKDLEAKKTEKKTLMLMLSAIEKIMEQSLDAKWDESDTFNTDSDGNLELIDFWDDDIFTEKELSALGVTADEAKKLLDGRKEELQKICGDLDRACAFKNKAQGYPDPEDEIKKIDKKILSRKQELKGLTNQKDILEESGEIWSNDQEKLRKNMKNKLIEEIAKIGEEMDEKTKQNPEQGKEFLKEYWQKRNKLQENYDNSLLIRNYKKFYKLSEQEFKYSEVAGEEVRKIYFALNKTDRRSFENEMNNAINVWAGKEQEILNTWTRKSQEIIDKWLKEKRGAKTESERNKVWEKKEEDEKVILKKMKKEKDIIWKEYEKKEESIFKKYKQETPSYN